MPSLSDIVGQAAAQITANLQSPQSSPVSSITNTISSGTSGAAGVPRSLGNPIQVVDQVQQQVTNSVKNSLAASARDLGSQALNFLPTSGTKLASPISPSDFAQNLSSGNSPAKPLTGLIQVPPVAAAAAGPGNSLSGALKLGDPMMSFLWYAELPDVKPIDGSPQKLDWYFVEEATPVFRSFENRTLFREGQNKHYASTSSLDSLRLAIFQDTGNKAMNYLQAWTGAVLAPITQKTLNSGKGRFGRPADYKKSIKIYLLNTEKKVLCTLEYVGCWPQTVDAYTLDSGSSTRVVNHVTFSVDDVLITLQSL